MSKYLVDENGVIVNEIYVGDRILRKSSIDANKDSLEINNGISFVKLYTNNLATIIEEIGPIEASVMLMLVPYIQYGSGLLVAPNGVPLTKNMLANILNKDLRNVGRNLEGLIRAELIGKHRTGKTVNYTVNPYVFCLGSKVHKVLHRLFENSRWAKGK